MRKEVRDKLIDDAMEAYVAWRQAGVDVDAAYQRWSLARSTDPASAYAAYAEALNWEELAAILYAERLRHAVVVLARDRRRRTRAPQRGGAGRRPSPVRRRKAPRSREASTARGRRATRAGGRGRLRYRPAS